MDRMLKNWKTSAAGIGILLATVGGFLQGDQAMSMNEIIQMLMAAGFISGKDASTGSAP